jgi:hypothetical protein
MEKGVKTRDPRSFGTKRAALPDKITGLASG